MNILFQLRNIHGASESEKVEKLKKIYLLYMNDVITGKLINLSYIGENQEEFFPLIDYIIKICVFVCVYIVLIK